MRLSKAIALAAVLVGAAAAASFALAANSNLSIASHSEQGPNPRFNGVLSSDSSSCVKGTKVKLHFDKPGGGKHFKTVATDTADKHGKWVVRFEIAIPIGSYYASVGKDGACPAVKTTVVKISTPE